MEVWNPWPKKGKGNPQYSFSGPSTGKANHHFVTRNIEMMVSNGASLNVSCFMLEWISLDLTYNSFTLVLNQFYKFLFEHINPILYPFNIKVENVLKSIKWRFNKRIVSFILWVRMGL